MGALLSVENELNKCSITFKKNEKLAKHTTFKIGGEAKIFAIPKNEAELIKLFETCKEFNVRYYVLGKGSNILFADEGFDGVIIKIADAFSQISVNENEITAYAGASLSELSKTAKENSLAGLEFAYGIPGNVGGAVYMNAGAYGGEIKDVISSVSFIDDNFKIRTLSKNELNFGYRTSDFEKNNYCILKAVFCLEASCKNEINDKMQKFMSSRIEKQPLNMPSAGSAFKRPVGAFAGALIEQCGLRGYSVGDAAISTKHCGFIVNLGNATCNDVLTLADEVCKTVKEKTGYTLEKEIRVVK